MKNVKDVRAGFIGLMLLPKNESVVVTASLDAVLIPYA